MNKSIIIWIFVFLISIQFVQSLGISPGRTTINFVPNLEKEVEFKVYNNEHKDIKVAFRIEGEFDNIITLPSNVIEFKSTDDFKLLKYKIKLPNEIKKPGAHNLNIMAVEVPNTASDGIITIMATVAVITQLQIVVPTPGRYLEASIRIAETADTGPITFIIPIQNLGTQPITTVEGTIDIIGINNESVGKIKTESVGLESGESFQLQSIWDTSNIKPGRYLAKLEVTYDTSIANAELVFNYGNILIDVLDVYVKEFKLGEIAKFHILVENKYSEEIKGVYATMDFFDQTGGLIISSKSAGEDIPSGVTEELETYWDTSDVKEGTYDSTLKVYYLDKINQKQLRIVVGLNSIKVGFVGATAQAISVKSALNNNTLLLIIIIILLVANIIWVVHFKKREKKD